MDNNEAKMTMEQTFKTGEAEGHTSQVSHQFYDWEEEGQTLYCRIVDFEEFSSKEYDGTYYRYIAQSDEGLVGIICGKMFDLLFQEKTLTGKLLRIEYLGQKQLEAGRTVNQFRVDILKE